jgi:MoaA/NifB/PqqE/SkfB family radical SAM enzyme
MYRWLSVPPKLVGYKLFRKLNFPKLLPISLTVSVTNNCNSRCKTCNIWKLYADNPQLEEKELRLQEFENIFENIGHSVIWFTLSGGEPFLRPDLVSIGKSLYGSCKPKILIIPTNGLLPNLIVNKAKEILDVFQETSVIVNLSLDGIGNSHDEMRGMPKNFEKAMITYRQLRDLTNEFDNLEVGVHSVVSKFNVDRLLELYNYVKAELDPDSYICEIAELRSELFNLKDDIAPDIFLYENAIEKLREKLKEDYFNKRGIPKLIQAFRLEYYSLVVEELRQRRQIIPCYAGFASCQISSYGDVWPCCIQAYDSSMGNLRDVEYDIRRIWRSSRAEEIRKGIKAGLCYCPMANVHYTNMLLHVPTALKVVNHTLISGP